MKAGPWILGGIGLAIGLAIGIQAGWGRAATSPATHLVSQGSASRIPAARPPSVSSLAREIERSLPAAVRLERLVTTEHHVALEVEAPDLAAVADLLASLPEREGLPEPWLRSVEKGDHGYDVMLVVAASAARRVDPRESAATPSPFERSPIRTWILKTLLPPFT